MRLRRSYTGFPILPAFRPPNENKSNRCSIRSASDNVNGKWLGKGSGQRKRLHPANTVGRLKRPGQRKRPRHFPTQPLSLHLVCLRVSEGGFLVQALDVNSYTGYHYIHAISILSEALINVAKGITIDAPERVSRYDAQANFV